MNNEPKLLNYFQEKYTTASTVFSKSSFIILRHLGQALDAIYQNLGAHVLLAQFLIKIELSYSKIPRHYYIVPRSITNKDRFLISRKYIYRTKHVLSNEQ
jgi:hypothetical protein